jgi:cation diffusion facilitator family transporter
MVRPPVCLRARLCLCLPVSQRISLRDIQDKGLSGCKRGLIIVTDANLHQQIREKRLVATTSVVAAVFLTGLKLVIGLMTGSLGILAEAVHSGLDLAAAGITLLAVRISDRPADESHLYGHGKVENLSAFIETLLLLITCFWIFYEAIRRLFFETVEINPNFWAFFTMAVSIVIDFSRSRALARTARKYHSQALEADALHFSTDIWSSAVVIVGLAMVRFGEGTSMKAVFARADAGAALIVALIVVYVSVQLGRRTIDGLLDRAPKGMAEKFQAAASGVSGVLRVSRVRLRNVGSQIFVDLNIDVPRHLSFEQSHDIAQRVQEAVRDLSPNADVVVHADPVADREGVLERVQAVAIRLGSSVHNVTTHWTGRGIWIDLDLEVDPSLSFEKAHQLATELEDQLRAECVPGDGHAAVADVHVHIEPRPELLARGLEVQAAEAEQYRNRIEAICRELRRARGCRDIELHVLKGKVYLSLHLFVDLHCSVAEVHGIAEELESRLRLEFPQLGRVVIHAEPAGGPDPGNP